jgi:hypothetical protein
MKSHYFIFIFALILGSCTNDENPSSGNALVLKKLTLTYPGGNNSHVIEKVFNYENNVLVSIAEGSTDTTKYQYSGNKITKVEHFQSYYPHFNPTLVSSETLTYEGDDLKYIISSDGSKRELIYSNGKLSQQNLYFGSLGGGDPDMLLEQYNLTYNQGNLVEQTYQSYQQGIVQFTATTTYQYDSKNNLMKNMNPYLKFFFVDLISRGFTPFSQNNVVASTDTYQGSSTGGTEYVYDIIYNADNYPVKITKSYKESHNVILVVDVEYL